MVLPLASPLVTWLQQKMYLFYLSTLALASHFRLWGSQYHSPPLTSPPLTSPSLPSPHPISPHPISPHPTSPHSTSPHPPFPHPPSLIPPSPTPLPPPLLPYTRNSVQLLHFNYCNCCISIVAFIVHCINAFIVHSINAFIAHCICAFMHLEHLNVKFALVGAFVSKFNKWKKLCQ